jgi:hypothetical protein
MNTGMLVGGFYRWKSNMKNTNTKKPVEQPTFVNFVVFVLYSLGLALTVTF